LTNSLKYILVIIALGLLSLLATTLQAQSPLSEPGDSTIVKRHSPSRAAVLSAVLPGLGQAYNKKYWKIPIIYAGVASIGYFIYFNNSQYLEYKNLYIAESELPNPDSRYLGLYEDYAQAYRRNRDLSVIGLLAFWGLNVIDANVDAHFFNYDISPDLSLEVKPVYLSTFFGALQPGLLLSLKF
jgi:hypothetical protein